MKKYFYIFIIGLLSACTMLGLLPDEKITSEQERYINTAITCDAKTADFVILNDSESLGDFFSEDGEFFLTLRYKKTSSKSENELKIIKYTEGSGEYKNYYLAEFKGFTLPFSRCRKIKTKPKYF